MRRWFATSQPELFLLAALLLIGALPNGLLAQDAASSAPLLTLGDAVQIAVTSNRPLQIAGLEVDKSKWEVAATKTQRLPGFKTYLFASGFLNSPTFQFRRGLFGEVGGSPIPSKDIRVPLSQGVTGNALAQVSQPVSQLYRLHLGIRAQELSTDLAREKQREQRHSVVKDVKQAYYAVVQSQSSITASQANIKQYQELDRVMADRLAQEAVLKSDTLEVKAKLAQEQYKLLQLNDDLQTRKEYLNNLMGRDIGVDFHTEDIVPPSTEELDLKAAQQAALSQRPEIKQAEIQSRQAAYDVRISRSKYIPDIGLALHYLSPLSTDILPKNIVSAGAEFSWEPFDWGRRRDEINQKKIVVDQSQYQLKEAQSKVLQDVNNRYRKLAEARMLLTVAQAAREAAVEKLREANQKFQQQAVLLRDVLQQQAAVASANDDYQQALLAFWTSKADFEKALGED